MPPPCTTPSAASPGPAPNYRPIIRPWLRPRRQLHPARLSVLSRRFELSCPVRAERVRWYCWTAPVRTRSVDDGGLGPGQGRADQCLRMATQGGRASGKPSAVHVVNVACHGLFIFVDGLVLGLRKSRLAWARSELSTKPSTNEDHNGGGNRPG